MEQYFFELLSARESCRRYDADKPVERHKLEQCLKAAQLAPSACNSQPWHFMVIKRKELVQQVAGATEQPFTLQAPVFIAVTEQPALLSKRVLERMDSQHFAQMDIGIAVAQLCLAATAQGLSTCILGWYNDEKVRALLNIEQECLRLLVAVGYAAAGELRAKKRKDIWEISSFIE